MTKPRRIALLAGGLSATSFGVKKAVEALSGALAGAGLEVKVFGMGKNGSKDSLDPNWQGSAAQAFGTKGPLKFGYMPELYDAVCAYNPDLVHLNGIWMHSSIVALKLARAGVAPYVVSPHGMLAPESLRYSQLKKKIALRLFQRASFDRASGYIATSKQEAADITISLPHARVHIVPNTVRLPNSMPKPIDTRERRVIAVGRLHPVKGFDRLLKAWMLVEDRFPEWSLEIRGPAQNGYDRELARLRDKLGQKRVLIGGPIFNDERDALVSNSRVFALPSRTENFSIAVVEALYCGTPVIASYETPWAELARVEAGWWGDCEPNRLAETLAEAMALTEAELSAMSERGMKWAHDMFSPMAVAQQMTNAYADFLA
jgi:glycosyltransferase involved in cell wall biosynthesis